MRLDERLRKALGKIPGYEKWREKATAKLESWGFTDEKVQVVADATVAVSAGVMVVVVGVSTGGAGLLPAMLAAKRTLTGWNLAQKFIIVDTDTGQSWAVDVASLAQDAVEQAVDLMK